MNSFLNPRSWLCGTAILITLFCGSLTASAAVGNGDGYNGPQLSGLSIPVNNDRLLSRDQVEEAYARCTHDLVITWGQQIVSSTCNPDPQSPIKETLNRKRHLNQASYGEVVQGKKFPITADDLVLEIGNDYTSVNIMGIDDPNKLPQLVARSSRICSFSNTSPDQPSAMNLSFETRDESEWAILKVQLYFAHSPGKDRSSTLVLKNGLPYMTYQPIEPAPHYDELGNLEPRTDVQVRDLVIHPPRDPKAHFYNYDTGRKVNLNIPAEAFATCLQSALQK